MRLKWADEWMRLQPMRSAWLIIGSSLLAACHAPRETSMLPRPEAFAHFKDRLAAQLLLWGIRWRIPCSDLQEYDQCFKFSEPQHMHGLWRDQFEGSEFCEGRATQCY